MKTVTQPKVRLLARGELFEAKQMEAKSGELLPKHLATIESVLVVLEGVCVLTLGDDEHTLRQGDSFIVPSDIVHQIMVKEDFKAVHVMTKDIEFKFFK